MRNEIIIAINNLFDENVDLKVRNEYLENKIKSEKTCVEPVSSSYITDLIIRYGKEQLMKDTINSSNYVRVNRNEETGELVVRSFEKWLNEKITTYYIPDYMSKEDIKNILYEDLKEIYEKEKSEAIKEFEKEETKGE